MPNILKIGVRKSLRLLGYEIVAHDPKRQIGYQFPSDFEDELINTILHVWTPDGVRRLTMTSPERLAALVNSIEFIVRNDIEGAIVECGVWRGGSMMAAALTLIRLNCTNRDLYLFDTFAGMPLPGESDVDYRDIPAAELLASADRNNSTLWAYCQMEEVADNIGSTGYDKDRIHLIRGRVEETIPQQVPDKIAVLRLDTDWYDSTRHELVHLFPRLVSGGVLIVDDYGHWKGARRAVDEYLSGLSTPVFLHRIDYTGRIAIKP